ncbi:TPA: ribosome maturation factor RimP [Candidatus Acetothermia bacterium]|nr:ribosome maturation factor RimP [Candidatus Acetothermia bacterium]
MMRSTRTPLVVSAPADTYNARHMEPGTEVLDSLLRQGAAQAHVEVYHWELHRWGRQARVAVQVDRPGGVTVDDCARASRVMAALLDQADPLTSSYLLEVSSPGVERVLWEPRHYAQAVGKLIQLKLSTAGARRGRLVGATDTTITVDLEGTTVGIPLVEVERARVVYEKEQGSR